MKKFLIASLGISLVMLFASTVMGAVHPIGFPEIDTLYSIEDAEPYLCGSFFSVPDGHFSILSGEYYQNDQFFVSGLFIDPSIGFAIQVEGSYLFDSGLFIGLGYMDSDLGGSSYLLAPGYRWALDDRSYLAFSLDYLDGEILGYDIDAKYCTDAMKLVGQLCIDNAGNFFCDLDLNYQVSDDLVVGGEIFYVYTGDMSFEAGITWKPGSLVIDAVIDSDGDYYLSGVCYFGEFGIGLDYDGRVYDLKVKYDTGDSRFTLIFTPEQDHVPMIYEISYTRVM